MLPLILPCLLFLSLLILLKLVTWCVDECSRVKRAFRRVPGPRGWPFIGNILEINGQMPFESFTKLAKKYGPVCRIRIFGSRIVILSSVESINEALYEKGHDFSGRPHRFFRAEFLADGAKDIVSASPCPAWSSLRKAVQYEIKRYDPDLRLLELVTSDILADMVEQMRSQGGMDFDPLDIVYEAVLGFSCLFLIGDKPNPSESDVIGKMRTLVDGVSKTMNVGGEGMELDFFPWLRFFGNETYKRLLATKRIRDEIFNWMMAKVKDDLKYGDHMGGVLHRLYSQMCRGSADINETNIKLAMMNIMIGSTSSTHRYTYIFLNLMLHYPQVQVEMRQEVDKIVGGRHQVYLSDRSNMPYSLATVYELLRFGSLGPILIPHRSLVNSSIQKYQIPADTLIFMNSRAVHHDEKFWGDPFTFRPGRFINGETGQILPPNHAVRKRIFSFSGGPRGCPGESLGLSRIFLSITTLVRNFEILPPSDGKLVAVDPRSYSLGLVLMPQRFNVRLVNRA